MYSLKPQLPNTTRRITTLDRKGVADVPQQDAARAPRSDPRKPAWSGRAWSSARVSGGGGAVSLSGAGGAGGSPAGASAHHVLLRPGRRALPQGLLSGSRCPPAPSSQVDRIMRSQGFLRQREPGLPWYRLAQPLVEPLLDAGPCSPRLSVVSLGCESVSCSAIPSWTSTRQLLSGADV